MSFLSIAQNRYTTKKYDASKKLSDTQVEQLKEILRLSPSSINSQPWKFAFISDPDLKGKFAEVSFFNKPKIENASQLVVFYAIQDIPMFEAHIQKNLPEGSVAYYNNFLKGLPEHKLKSWFEHQVYLSLGYFLAACAAMDIDATPMEGIDIAAYEQLLPVEGYKPLFGVAIGYRDATDANQPVLKPKFRFDKEHVLIQK